MKSLYDLIDKKSPCFIPCKWVAQVNIIGGQEREMLVLTPSRCKGMAFDSTSATGNFII
jgi:hypothetical protein